MHSNVKNLFIFFLMGLTACTAKYFWINPDYPNANYAADEYECTNLANRSVPVFDSSDYIPPPAINVSPSPNLGCNNPNVSPVNCYSSSPQSVVPLGDKALLGQTTYQLFVEQCLHKKGWQKDKVNN